MFAVTLMCPCGNCGKSHDVVVDFLTQENFTTHEEYSFDAILYLLNAAMTLRYFSDWCVYDEIDIRGYYGDPCLTVKESRDEMIGN